MSSEPPAMVPRQHGARPAVATGEPTGQEAISPEPERPAAENTYGQILKSSTLIGGSSVLNIAVGIVRNKAMAVFLGPAGFGLLSLYGSIADLAQSVAGMGVNSSGVRQIAEAAGSGESQVIARTVTVLRRTSVVLGVLGAVLLVAFSSQVSTMTFGDDAHTAAIWVLSLAVLFRLVSAGQTALIQGMRRISDLAIMGVLAGLLGLLVSIPIVYVFREEGVAPSLVAVAAAMVITSWWYSRKVRVEPPAMSAYQVKEEVSHLLKLGVAFMASGLLVMGAAYAVRMMVVRMVSVDAAGFYQAAWTLGGLYVGFILQAMGADFYPRLTAVARDNGACNRVVNEQAQVSLLLAGPGVIATLTFAPFVVELFYSDQFGAAVEVLRWICLGMALRVITWPMGFIILAKGAKHYFFWTEFAWTLVNIGLSWVCVRTFGLNGSGIAFFGSYVFHGLMMYPVVRHLSGFSWSRENWKTGALFLLSIAVVSIGFYVLPSALSTALGTVASALSAIYSTRVVLGLIPPHRIPNSIQKPLRRVRLMH